MSNPYKSLKEIIEREDHKVKELKTYLEDIWYNAHYKMPWYDIHKHK